MYFDNEVDQIRSDKCHFLKGPPRAMRGGPCTSSTGMYEGVSLPTPAEVLDGFNGARFPVTRSELAKNDPRRTWETLGKPGAGKLGKLGCRA